jgi:hypothetical protein
MIPVPILETYDAWQLKKALDEGRNEDAKALAVVIGVGVITEVIPGNKIIQKVVGGVKKNLDKVKLLDKDTVLKGGEFTKTKIRVKGGAVYKGKNGRYCHRDTLHMGKGSELEVYDKLGKHIGTANPKTGKIDFSGKKSGRSINVK